MTSLTGAATLDSAILRILRSAWGCQRPLTCGTLAALSPGPRLMKTQALAALTSLTALLAQPVNAQVPWDSPEALVDITTVPGAAVDEGFGTAIAVSETTLMVGMPGRSPSNGDESRVFVFERSPSNALVHTQTLSLTSDLATSTLSRFGNDIAIQGDTAIISAPSWPIPGVSSTGLAVVFRRDRNGTWNPVFSHPVRNIASVALDGARAVASGGPPNFVYVLEQDSASNWSATILSNAAPPSTLENFAEVAIAGNRIAVSGTTQAAPYRDAVGIMELEPGGEWVMRAVLTSDLYAPFSNHWGETIALQGDKLYVSAPDAYFLGTWSGCVFEYSRLSPSFWIETAAILPEAGSLVSVEGFEFGRTLVSSAERIAIGGAAGKPLHTYQSSSAGPPTLTGLLATNLPVTN